MPDITLRHWPSRESRCCPVCRPAAPRNGRQAARPGAGPGGAARQRRLDSGHAAFAGTGSRATERGLRDTGVVVKPHDFRRTVATLVADKSKTKDAMALLGHSTEATTLRHYIKRTHIAPDLRDVLDVLVRPVEAAGRSK